MWTSFSALVTWSGARSVFACSRHSRRVDPLPLIAALLRVVCCGPVPAVWSCSWFYSCTPGTTPDLNSSLAPDPNECILLVSILAVVLLLLILLVFPRLQAVAYVNSFVLLIVLPRLVLILITYLLILILLLVLLLLILILLVGYYACS